MIAFVQPFGLRDAGGGARILRALLEEAPEPYLSVCTHARGPRELAEGCEVHLPTRPYFGRIERTRLNRYLHYGLSAVRLHEYYAHRFEERLEALFRERGVTAVHAIPHGLEFWWAFRVARRLKIPFYLNVHDDLRYNLRGHPHLDKALKWLARAWARADGRIVISDTMGEEYARRYGARDYEVITDGLNDPIRSVPRERRGASCRMYFLGAMHLTYHANVDALEEALYRLEQTGEHDDVSMTLRGSAMPVRAPRIAVEERPFAPEELVLRDFSDVDVLYLPLPFGEEYAPFWRYSMSTKLVTYLGTGLPILYHGPEEAAVARLLASYDAAVQVHSLDPVEILQGIRSAMARHEELAANALALGEDRFSLHDQRARFWEMVGRSATVRVERKLSESSESVVRGLEE